jgi:hypothetical protein
LSFTLLVFAAGCSYPNQFRNIPTDSPHAVLVGDGVTLFYINGQPTSFWRMRERFRIPGGLTTVRVISGYYGDVQYPLIQFTAEASHSYSIVHQRIAGSDSVILLDGRERLAQVEREQER